MKKNKLENGIILFQNTPIEFILRIIKTKLFSVLSKQSMSAFVRGGDIISIGPIAFGTHEPQVAAAIKHFSDAGYRDFLIDIGANIGLTSLQCGSWFKTVFAFEPNPLCHGILETNLMMNLEAGSFNVLKFGLGANEQECKLRVPRHNWGGAHIINDDNSYSEDILLAKDGFSEIDERNYVNLSVNIKSAKKEIKKLFTSLIEAKMTSGVIKIDVEGFEPLIIKAIAETITDKIEVCVIFENLASTVNLDLLASLFSRPVSIYYLEKTDLKGGNIQKLISLFLKNGYKFSFQKINQSVKTTDIVFVI